MRFCLLAQVTAAHCSVTLETYSTMTGLPSVFKSKNVLNAKVLQMAVAHSWNSTPLLLRLITQEQKEILLVATDDAKTSLMSMQKGVAYNITVPGACVKQSDAAKTGVPCKTELRMRYKVQFDRDTATWPTQVPYQFVKFVELSKVDEGSWVDVIGFVTEIRETVSRDIKAAKGPAYTLQSREIILQSGEFHESVELLGGHTDMTIKVGDVMAVRQAKMSSWNQIRKLSTGVSTHIVVNPAAASNIDAPVKPRDASTPTKKAAGTKDIKIMTLQDIRVQRDALLRAVRVEGQDPKTVRVEAATKAKFVSYDNGLFETGFPFYGSDEQPMMKFPVVLQDETGQLSRVTLWHDACQKLFQTDAPTCLNLWQACDSDEGKEEMLEKLNAQIDTTFQFWMTLTAWCPENDIQKAMIRVSINQITDASV